VGRGESGERRKTILEEERIAAAEQRFGATGNKGRGESCGKNFGGKSLHSGGALVAFKARWSQTFSRAGERGVAGLTTRISKKNNHLLEVVQGGEFVPGSLGKRGFKWGKRHSRFMLTGGEALRVKK